MKKFLTELDNILTQIKIIDLTNENSETTRVHLRYLKYLLNQFN